MACKFISDRSINNCVWKPHVDQHLYDSIMENEMLISGNNMKQNMFTRHARKKTLIVAHYRVSGYVSLK